MAENSRSLMDLKKESEELNNSIHALLDEAVTYKNATGALLPVTERLHTVSTNITTLSEKANRIIETLEEIHPNEIHEIRSDIQHLVDRNEFIIDRLEAIEVNQNNSYTIISEALQRQKEETSNSLGQVIKMIFVFGAITIILLVAILIKFYTM